MNERLRGKYLDYLGELYNMRRQWYESPHLLDFLFAKRIRKFLASSHELQTNSISWRLARRMHKRLA